jgi:hypothetical protein
MPDSGDICGALATDVDHIKNGDDHRDSNLRALCGPHHRQKSSREGAQAANANRRKIAQRFVRDEDHPGLM